MTDARDTDLTLVLRVAGRVARGKDAEDPEGIAQEVAFRFSREVADGRSPAHAGAWAARVATRLCIDEHRRRVIADDIDDAGDDEARLRNEGPSARVIARAQVRTALGPLSARDRDLLLGDAAGEPHAELAARLGFASASAATKRLHDVRRTLVRRHGRDLEPQRLY